MQREDAFITLSSDISDGPFNPYFGSSLLEDVADLVHLDDRRLGLVAAGVEGVRVGRVGALHRREVREGRKEGDIRFN